MSDIMLENNTTKLYPDLGVAAMKTKTHRGMLLWLLARKLSGGDQLISAKALLEYCTKTLGVVERTYHGYLKVATDFGLLTKVKINRGSAANSYAYLITGVVKAARLYDVSHFSRTVIVKTHLLLHIADFKAACYGAFIESNTSRGPVSQDTLTDLTGVLPRTQYNYRERANITATPNIVILDTPAGDANYVAGIVESQQNVFVMHDNGKKVLACRLPNSYTTDFEQAARGSTKRINADLFVANGSSRTNGWERASLKKHARTFWSDQRAAEKTKDKVVNGVPAAFEPGNVTDVRFYVVKDSSGEQAKKTRSGAVIYRKSVSSVAKKYCN